MSNYKIQKATQTKPLGWIKAQMENDLKNGFVGHLDKLVPSLFVEDDIYGANRRGKKLKNLNLGLSEDENIDETQLQWWNSETQSQWYDGLIRHSYLLENNEFINICKKYVDRMLSYQDEDGYMGIYDKETRFNFNNESGELWAQATLFRALLSYYDATKEEEVLKSVIKAVDVTMKNYNNNRNYIFNFEQSHGLMFTDILDKLFLLTKDIKYIYYADYLYKQLLISDLKMGVDVKEKDVFDGNYKLQGHGVHTYEHLRTLVTLAFNDYDDTVMKNYYLNLFSKYLEKIDQCISPSGGPIGDEWIGGNIADSSMTGYEYCSIQELMHTYMFLLEKTGDLKWADKIENIIFNAAQGARHNEDSSIAYLKSDNSYSMTGGFQYVREDSPHKAQVRYKYSPTHQDAAVCCVPNAGRIMPYYLQSQWLEKDNCLLKTTYGESVFDTKVEGVNISIKEKSNYPFSGKMLFQVSVSAEIELDIAFRIPNWCKKNTVRCNMKHIEDKDKIIFSGLWKNMIEIGIDFEFEFVSHKDLLGDYYFSYGPLVLALPIKSEQQIGKEYGICNLHESLVIPIEEIPLNLIVDDTSLNSLAIISDEPSWNKIEFEIDLLDKKDDMKMKRMQLVPMGGVILRKVTFKK